MSIPRYAELIKRSKPAGTWDVYASHNLDLSSQLVHKDCPYSVTVKLCKWEELNGVSRLPREQFYRKIVVHTNESLATQIQDIRTMVEGLNEGDLNIADIPKRIESINSWAEFRRVLEKVSVSTVRVK